MHKPIITKFEKWKVESFTDNDCGADLADVQLMSRFNKGIGFLIQMGCSFGRQKRCYNY